MMFEADFSEKDRNSQALSQENRISLALVEQGIRHCEDGHYELPLPLNESSASLPNNQEVALRRLSQLKRRIKSDQKYKEDYTTFMENLIKNGHAERVPPDECLLWGSSQDIKSSLSGKGNVWYTPHHGIYHPSRPPTRSFNWTLIELCLKLSSLNLRCKTIGFCEIYYYRGAMLSFSFSFHYF